MRISERGSIDSSLGISRRTLLRRGAIAGGALVWTTPVVQSLAGPAMAAGTQIGELKYVAILVNRAGVWYRMKWSVAFLGMLNEDTGPGFAVPGSLRQLQPLGGSVEPGGAPGTSAALNADGSITVHLGAGCKLVDFVVASNQHVAGPGQGGEPSSGQTGGTVHFTVPTSSGGGQPAAANPAGSAQGTGTPTSGAAGETATTDPQTGAATPADSGGGPTTPADPTTSGGAPAEPASPTATVDQSPAVQTPSSQTTVTASPSPTPTGGAP
jgi:hypothetical protein